MNTPSAHESSAGTNPPAEPPTAAESARRHRLTHRREEHQREVLERRRIAEQRADTLIAAACANANAPAALGDVALRAAEALDVDECELLVIRAADHALLVEIRVAAPSLNVKMKAERRDPARKATMRLGTVRVPPTASPATLLRGDGPANRVTVFIHDSESFRLLGVLSVARTLNRQLTIEDRGLANALGDRLAVAIARGDFPGFG